MKICITKCASDNPSHADIYDYCTKPIWDWIVSGSSSCEIDKYETNKIQSVNLNPLAAAMAVKIKCDNLTTEKVCDILNHL